MDALKQEVIDWISWFAQNLYKVSAGVFTAIIGYFIPIRDFVHLLIFLLIVDMLIGYWANKKTRGEKFLMTKVWSVTIPRMVVGIALIMCAFLWDTIYHQDTVSTYVITGWILSGATLVSITQNGFKVTHWAALNDIGNLIKEKLPKKIKIKTK